MIHGFAVIGVIAVLGGSIWQMLAELRSYRRVLDDHVAYDDLRKEAKREHPWWMRRRRKQAVEAVRAIWTVEDQREYRRALRSGQAWVAIVIGTGYSLIVSIATP